jgi:flagellar protein FliS
MFISASARSASAYKVASVEASVEMADAHGLINLLFDALIRAVKTAKIAINNGDIPVKCKQIGSAIRILEDGLILGLNAEDGGELAKNLRDLYGYCVMRLVHANSKSDASALDEVVRLIEPVADGWKQIKDNGPAYLRPV